MFPPLAQLEVVFSWFKDVLSHLLFCLHVEIVALKTLIMFNFEFFLNLFQKVKQ